MFDIYSAKYGKADDGQILVFVLALRVSVFATIYLVDVVLNDKRKMC